MSTTATGIASCDELGTALRGNASDRALEALLQAAQSSCAHERHVCGTQWVVAEVQVGVKAPQALTFEGWSRSKVPGVVKAFDSQ